MNQTIHTGTIYKYILKLPCIPALLILKLLLHIKDTEMYVAIMKTQKTYFTVLLLHAMHFRISYSHNFLKFLNMREKFTDLSSLL